MPRLADIMTRDVATISADATLRDAAELLVGRHIGGAPVVDGGHVVGVVSLNDILEFDSTTAAVPTERLDQAEWGDVGDTPEGWDDESEPPGTFFSELWTDAGAEVVTRMETTDSPEWDKLRDHTVAEAMSPADRVLRPTSRVDEAADYMRRHGLHRVLVMQDGRLEGIVTTMDVTAAVADHRIAVNRYVFDTRRR